MRQQDICNEYEKELTQKEEQVRQMQDILDSIENETVEQEGDKTKRM